MTMKHLDIATEILIQNFTLAEVLQFVRLRDDVRDMSDPRRAETEPAPAETQSYVTVRVAA